MNTWQLLEILAKHVFIWLFLGAFFTLFPFIKLKNVLFFIKWFCVRATIPCMIFSVVLMNFKKDSLCSLFGFSALGFAFAFFSWLCSLMVSKIKITEEIHWPTFHLGNTFNNYGFMAYGLVANLFGSQIMPKLFAFVLGSEFLLWTFGVSLFSKSKGFSARPFFSPPAIAMLLAVMSIFFFPFSPENHWIGQSIILLGEIAIPMALTCIGFILSHSLKNFSLTIFKSVWLIQALSFRHIVFPGVVIFGLAIFIPEGDFRKILVIESIMPMAMMVTTVASLYGGDHAKLGFISTLSQVLGLLTIPFWLIILQNLGLIV